MKRARTVLLVLYGVALLQLAWYIPQMPPVLATHYDASGAPNGSMTRMFALGFHLLMLGITAAAFIGLPALIGRMAPTLLNLPNRNYWLAPERRAESITALQGRVAVLGCGALLLMLAVSELNFRANLSPSPRLEATSVLALLVGFLLFMAFWIVSLHRRFPKPPA